jgi:hypothetical protein
METPLLSAQVTTFEARRESSRHVLSEPQLQALSAWLGSHQSGWQGVFTEASSEARPFVFSLKDASGRTAAMEVVAREHGGYYLRFSSSLRKVVLSVHGRAPQGADSNTGADRAGARL